MKSKKTKKQPQKQIKTSGVIEFDAYYFSLWGERWEALRRALLEPEIQVLRWNRWALNELNSPPGEDFLPGCTLRPLDFRGPGRTPSGLLDCYVMDPASVIAARCLPVQDGDLVLDLCAAPGGKTLILAENLVQSGELVANELSPERRGRLQKVIQNYIPREVRERVWVKGQDGSRWGLKQPSHFGAVLIDAPCSGERHLLENPSELELWSPKRGEGLAHRQYALLCSAFMSTAPGGYFLYSTCSINAVENEEVVRKFVKKKTGFEIRSPSGLNFAALRGLNFAAPRGPEQREFGQVFLPDQCGFGPLYFCLFQKAE